MCQNELRGTSGSSGDCTFVAALFCPCSQAVTDSWHSILAAVAGAGVAGCCSLSTPGRLEVLVTFQLPATECSLHSLQNCSKNTVVWAAAPKPSLVSPLSWGSDPGLPSSDTALVEFRLGKRLSAGPAERRGCVLALTPDPACREAARQILMDRGTARRRLAMEAW